MNLWIFEFKLGITKFSIFSDKTRLDKVERTEFWCHSGSK